MESHKPGHGHAKDARGERENRGGNALKAQAKARESFPYTLGKNTGRRDEAPKAPKA